MPDVASGAAFRHGRVAGSRSKGQLARVAVLNEIKQGGGYCPRDSIGAPWSTLSSGFGTSEDLGRAAAACKCRGAVEVLSLRPDINEF